MRLGDRPVGIPLLKMSDNLLAAAKWRTLSAVLDLRKQPGNYKIELLNGGFGRLDTTIESGQRKQCLRAERRLSGLAIASQSGDRNLVVSFGKSGGPSLHLK